MDERIFSSLGQRNVAGTEIGQDFKGDLITKRRKMFFSRGPLKVLVLHLNKSVKTNIAPIQSVSSRLCKETTEVTNSRKGLSFSDTENNKLTHT